MNLLPLATRRPSLCAQCARALASHSAPRRIPAPPPRATRRAASSPSGSSKPAASAATEFESMPSPPHEPDDDPPTPVPREREPEPVDRALSRRLEEATEEALLSGRTARRAVLEEAGFSEELKARLIEKITSSSSPSNLDLSSSTPTTALNTSGNAIPASAGLGTRHVASSPHWTGAEEAADAVLRMLDDAHKPLRPGERGSFRVPTPTGVWRVDADDHAASQRPVVVDMRLKRQRPRTPGRRAADARDRAAAYAGLREGGGQIEKGARREGDGKEENGLSEKEREDQLRELKERFQPGWRAMPNTISGLAALADERIQDAIARGQFKNIPRGKGVERDTRADNPFIDTTEYIMNKMIKRQDMVPPWIEKQQELVRAAHAFRARLRSDWRRHAARVIASAGGGLDSQLARAREYARAEEAHNPRRRNVDDIPVPANSTDDPVMVAVRRQAVGGEEAEAPPQTEGDAISSNNRDTSGTADAPPPPGVEHIHPRATLSQPFRDPDWEALERGYMTLAVRSLNSLARSYNLMAPDLAKKPYFSLERELLACYADVAPTLPDEIRRRAEGPAKDLWAASSLGGGGGGGSGFMGRFAGGEKGGEPRIADDRSPHYGLKEMWSDFWKSRSSESG